MLYVICSMPPIYMCFLENMSTVYDVLVSRFSSSQNYKSRDKSIFFDRTSEYAHNNVTIQLFLYITDIRLSLIIKFANVTIYSQWTFINIRHPRFYAIYFI